MASIYADFQKSTIGSPFPQSIHCVYAFKGLSALAVATETRQLRHSRKVQLLRMYKLNAALLATFLSILMKSQRRFAIPGRDAISKCFETK